MRSLISHNFFTIHFENYEKSNSINNYIIEIIVNCFLINTVTAQISINSDGATPDASAMLDVSSADKGILIPRMDSTSRKNIANPAITGLMVYDSTTNSFWYYANSVWNNMSNLLLTDMDGDTKIQVEESSDEDIIRFDLGGTEYMRLDNGRIEILNTGSSVFIGEGAGKSDDLTNNRNVFIGYQSGYSNTYGYYNTFQGYQSGYSNTAGDYNIFQGYQSGYSNTAGDYNIFLGYQSGYSNTAGGFNTFLGAQSGISNTTGDANTFQGYQSGIFNTTGNYNIFLGTQSGLSNTTGDKNVAIGFGAGYSNSTGENNVFLGYQAGYYETDSNKLYIDNSNTTSPLIYGEFSNDYLQINGTLNINNAFEFPTTDGTTNQYLTTDGNGTLSWQDNSTSLLLDTDGDTKIQVEESSDEDIIRFDLGGTEFFRLDSGRIEIVNTGQSIFIGEGAGENDDFSDNRNVFIGYESGNSNTTGSNNAFLGYRSGLSNTTGSSNIFTGYNSGLGNTTGHSNTFTGAQSGINHTTGSENTLYGAYTGYYSMSGSSNTFIGHASGYFTNKGDKNTFLGGFSGYNNGTGESNVSVGYQAGYQNNGDKNVFLGTQAGYFEAGSNKLYIENSNTTSPLIYGEFDNNWLQINGTLSIDSSVVIGADSLNYGGSGDEYKMFFDQSLGAFRAGRVSDENWNTDSLGSSSFSTGNSTLALGTNAVAFGGRTAAYGVNSLAGGGSSIAHAQLSTAIGKEVEAQSYAEFAIGVFNTIYTPTSLTSYDAADRLFVIGNGTADDSRSDALVIYKNGNAELNGALTINQFMRLDSGRIEVLNTGNSIFIGEGAGANDDFSNNSNIFLGTHSGYNNISGEKNVFIGHQAGFSETGSDKLYIENSTTSSPLIYGEFDNDRIVINGNSSNNTNNRTLFVNGSIGATSAFNNDSDRRLKKDIQTIPNALDKVLQMRGVTYQWKDGREEGDRMGFIAQEVETILPQVVDNKNDHYTMQYAPITAVLIEAVKEQQQTIKAQQNEIIQLKRLEKEVQDLKKNLEALLQNQ